jgi:hypothetical protein
VPVAVAAHDVPVERVEAGVESRVREPPVEGRVVVVEDRDGFLIQSTRPAWSAQ